MKLVTCLQDLFRIMFDIYVSSNLQCCCFHLNLEKSELSSRLYGTWCILLVSQTMFLDAMNVEKGPWVQLVWNRWIEGQEDGDSVFKKRPRPCVTQGEHTHHINKSISCSLTKWPMFTFSWQVTSRGKEWLSFLTTKQGKTVMLWQPC